jgi:trigger factor
LEIVLDKKSTTLASLKINIKEADYTSEVSKKLKDYSKKIVLKGFRPGKVPAQLIKKMYGKAILAEEVQKILNKELFGYISENELSIVGDPMPDAEAPAVDFDHQTDFEFTYRLGLAGDFELDLAKLSILKYVVNHTEAQINEILANLREQHGKHEHPETSEANDLLSGDLLQILPEVPEDEAQTEAIDQKIYIDLKEVVETSQAALSGLNKGAVLNLDLQNLFKENDQQVARMLGIGETEVANLTGEFQFTLQEIHRNIPAEMDKDFFEKVLDDETIETEEQFIEKIKSNIASNYAQSAENYIERQIFKQLPDSVNIELPLDFLKEWLKTVDDGKFTDEQIEKDFEAFIKNLKWDLIKNQIAKEQQFNVTNNDVYEQARIMVMAQFGGYIPQLDQNPEMAKFFDNYVNRFLEENDGRNYRSVIAKVLDSRVLEYVKQFINPIETDIDSKDFEKIYYDQS